MFEQQKYNLLREENEGFAKLIVELNQSNITLANIETVKANVEALIGYFNIDPNRVLDIILDSFENNLWNRGPYLRLLEDYQGKNISQLLGFKFQHHYDQVQAALKDKNLPRDEVESLLPKSLCTLTALLLAEHRIQPADIWPHLSSFKESDSGEVDELEVLFNRQNKLTDFHYR